MNLKFVLNDYILIWYLLFHQSISVGLNNYKQKIWKNYYKEYMNLESEKELILQDPKNYIPDNDIIYDIMKDFDEYEEIYRQTEQYKVNILKIWDEYKIRINKELSQIIRFDIDTYYILFVNPDLNIIDLSLPNTNKINTIVYGKTKEQSDVQNVLEVIYAILKRELREYSKKDQNIVEAILELAVLNELGTRLTGQSHYLIGKSEYKLLKRQIYPYFLMYLGIDRDDLLSYMRRDGIVFDISNYTNEVKLRKIDLKQFINFCINNQKIILRLDKLGVK